MGQKLIKKIAQNCVVFCTFSVIVVLKFFAGGAVEAMAPSIVPPPATPLVSSFNAFMLLVVRQNGIQRTTSPAETIIQRVHFWGTWPIPEQLQKNWTLDS